ncbi:hypothetical protein ACJRO7_017241 [Eucalyptus globulus]|uniref:Uncharacterized protein n=1 Tax=Eucalyptus globulus TaxID=34317 RepID=A0ABD3KPJ1_EUCGL
MPKYGSKRSWLPWGYDKDEQNDVLLETLEEGTFIEPEKHAERKRAEMASKINPPPSKPARGHESSRLSVILLDQGLLAVYKRLFVVCLTLNAVALVLAATGHFPYARNRAALFSIANIFALTLCRSEAVLSVAFWLAVKLLGHSWVPLFAKTAMTSLLQSLGWIHSGCGVSSLVWLVYALVLTLKDRDNTSPEIIGVASAILALIALSSLAAFPLRTNRFAGWSTLGLLLGFVIFTIAYDPRTKSYKRDELGSRLVRQQEFWFTVGITVLIIIPWVTVKRVPVKVSSSHWGRARRPNPSPLFLSLASPAPPSLLLPPTFFFLGRLHLTHGGRQRARRTAYGQGE